MTKHIHVLIGLLIVPVVVAKPSLKSCEPPKFSDIRVKENVDMERFTGTTWYQIEASPWTGSDVAERFYRIGHQLKVREAGRLLNGKMCRTYTYTVDGTAGRYTAVDDSDPSFHGQFLLLDTDYTTYFAGLSCFHINEKGVCSDYLASAYSSQPTRMLSREAGLKVDALFDDLCIHKFQKVNYTGKECLEWNFTR